MIRVSVWALPRPLQRWSSILFTAFAVFGLRATGKDLTCADLRRNVTEYTGTNAWLRLDVTHPVLDTNDGYIPGMQYNVRLTSLNATLAFAIYAVWSTDASTTGTFNNVPTGVNILPDCDALSGQIEQDNATKFTWQAANGTDSGCIDFVAIVKIGAIWFKLKRHLCENTKCLNFSTLLNGTISSPGFPDRIEGRNCTVVISVPKGFVIFLQFIHFDLSLSSDNTCLDYVIIDEPRDAAQGYKYCDRKIKEQLRDMAFVSSSGAFFITLISHLTRPVSGQGYQAKYYALKDGGCNSTHTAGSDAQNISSLNYPMEYFPNLRCVSIIIAEPGYRILLRILGLDVPGDASCENDKLVIKVFEEDPGTQLCGSMGNFSRDDLEFQSVSNLLSVAFISDYMLEGRGFYAQYTAVKSCSNTTVSQKTGDFHSINWPNGYLNSENCQTTIVTNIAERVIQVKFSYLVLESATGGPELDYHCTKDYIEISDGVDVHRRCGNWSGRESQLVFNSFTNKMVVRFSTNHNISRPGFNAEWSAVNNESAVLHVDCDSDWEESKKHCYKVFNEPRNWTEAATDCDRRLAYLAKVDNEETMVVITRLVLQNKLHKDISSYWIGANDRQFENDFFWQDGTPVISPDWFPGWSDYRNFSSQPNDDGMAEQDCVELRQSYPYPSKGIGVAQRLFWNDMSCSMKNSYICMRTKSGVHVPPLKTQKINCSSTLILSGQNDTGLLETPNFPKTYNNNDDCVINISIILGYRITLTFFHFQLEEDSSCRYDFLELTSPHSAPRTENTVRRCGDWEDKVKLLHYASTNNHLQLTFHSDHSRVHKGFQVRYSVIAAPHRCDELGAVPWSRSCYYFSANDTADLVNTSTKCRDVKSQPLVIESQVELNFITSYINTHYAENQFSLGELLDFNATQMKSTAEVAVTRAASPSQTGICYAFENGTIFSWKGNECDIPLNFICKTPFPEHSTATLTTTDATSGSLASADYHLSSQNYTNDEKHTVIITVPATHRIIFDIAFVDLEYQQQCLYDFLNFMDLHTNTSKRFCGYNQRDLRYASDKSSVNVTFFTDSSRTGRGFSLTWKSVDISECNMAQVTGEFGAVSSLNSPFFYLDNLDCKTWIVAATNNRLWLSFTKFELDYTDNICSDYLEITLSESTLSTTMQETSLKLCGDRNGRVNELRFVSFYNKILLRFHSDNNARSIGYQAEYKSIPDGLYSHTDMITVNPGETGYVVSPNYGTDYPVDLDYTVRIKTKLQYQITLQLVDIDLRLSGDCYYDSVTINDDIKTWQGEEGKMAVLCRNPTEATKWISHMNVISFRLQTKTRTNFGFKGTKISYRIRQDEFFWNKTYRRLNVTLEECSETTCKNNGTCRNTTSSGYQCDCKGIHTGLFCHITWCELRPSPCKEGKCEANGTYVCKCDQGYHGHDCDMTLAQCNADKCNNNGWCKPISRYGDYQCQCHTGWDGKVCDESADGTKSLGEILIEEPFWIGIIIILVALFLTLFVWCFRKKYAHNFHCFRRKKDKVLANHIHDISRRPSPGDLLVYNNPVFSREGSPRYTRSNSRSNSLSVDYKDTWGVPSRKGPEQNAAAAARFFASLNDITREKSLMDTAGANYSTDSDANYMGIQGGQILLTPANLTINQVQGGSVTPGPSPFHAPLAARSTDPGLKRVKSAREGGRLRRGHMMKASHKAHSFDYGIHHSDTEVVVDDMFNQFKIPNQRKVEATIEPHQNSLDFDLDPEARSSARRRRAFATTPQITIQFSPGPGPDGNNEERFDFEDEFGHQDGIGHDAQGDHHEHPRRNEKRLSRQGSSGDSTSIRLSPHGSERSSRSGSVDVCGGSRRGSSLEPTPRESRRHSLEPSREGSGHSTRRHSLLPSRDHSARGSKRNSLEPSRSTSRRGSAGHSPSSKSSRRSSIAVSRNVSQRSSRRYKKKEKRRNSDQPSPTGDQYSRRQSRDSYHGRSRDTDKREHQSGSKQLQNRYLRDVLRHHLKNFAHRDLSFDSTTGSDVGSVRSLGMAYLTESLDLPCDCDKCIASSSKHRHRQGHRRRNLEYYSPKDSFDSMPASCDVHSSDSLPSVHLGVRRTASAEPPGMRSSMRSSRSARGYDEEHVKQKSKKHGSGHHRHRHRSDSKESKKVRHERWATPANRGYSSDKDVVHLIPSIVVDKHRPVMQKSHSEDDYLNSRSQSPVNKMPAQVFLRVPEMFGEHDHSPSNESSSGIASSPSHSTAGLALSIPEGLDYNPVDYERRLFCDVMKTGARDRTDYEIIELENMVPVNSNNQNSRPGELRKDSDKTDPSESDRSSSSSGLGLMQGKRRTSLGSTSAIEVSDPDDLLLRNSGVLPYKSRSMPIVIRESHSMRRKHPFRDSAYQTKEHSMSKPPSNQVSPTLPNLIKIRPEPGISTKAQYTRPEDTAVTSQLFAAAKKLEHLQSDLNSRNNFESETPTTSTQSGVIYHPPVSRKRSYGNGKPINISDIPESSQEIEDETQGATRTTTDDSGHRGSYYSQESIYDRINGKMAPYNTFDTAGDSAESRDDEVFRTFKSGQNARSVLSVLERQRLSAEAEEYVV